jgi:hypothetical protein
MDKLMDRYIAWLWISGAAACFAVISGIDNASPLFLALAAPFAFTLVLTAPILLVLAAAGLAMRALR